MRQFQPFAESRGLSVIAIACAACATSAPSAGAPDATSIATDARADGGGSPVDDAAFVPEDPAEGDAGPPVTTDDVVASSCAHAGRIFFVAETEGGGLVLYRFDPTTRATVEVGAIDCGGDHGMIRGLAVDHAGIAHLLFLTPRVVTTTVWSVSATDASCVGTFLYTPGPGEPYLADIAYASSAEGDARREGILVGASNGPVEGALHRLDPATLRGGLVAPIPFGHGWTLGGEGGSSVTVLFGLGFSAGSGGPIEPFEVSRYTMSRVDVSTGAIRDVGYFEIPVYGIVVPDVVFVGERDVWALGARAARPAFARGIAARFELGPDGRIPVSPVEGFELPAAPRAVSGATCGDGDVDGAGPG